MIEFDPRGFTGELRFEDGNWIYAGEIIEDNHFTISGNYKVDQNLKDSLVWDDKSTVKRIFTGDNVIEFNKNNFKIPQEITYNGKKYNVDFFTGASSIY